MECPKCGKKIADDSRYCEFCGVRVYSVRSKWKKYALPIVASVLLVVTVVALSINYLGNNKSDLTYVEELSWEFPIGKAVYSGYAVRDSDKGLVPHAKGVAKSTDGEYAGSVYDGEFNMGKMEGRTKYTLSNGDIFVGEFKDNLYEKGKYIISSTGESFEGTFKNGEPDKGKWFDKNGNKI